MILRVRRAACRPSVRSPPANTNGSGELLPLAGPGGRTGGRAGDAFRGSGSGLLTVQVLLGHAHVDTTMMDLHVMKRPGAGGPSPSDLG